MLRLSAIFFASGFAGLIYESIWTHYLKLFLGHAAYAQTLVLGIFMGGMALGAAVAARRTASLRAPLAAYAVIELAIGVLALGFHPVFIGATEGFYDFAFAQQLAGMPFMAAKWGLAALLILPQSILLGATFPVFAAAVIRANPAATGRSLATLYFANSLGGGLGVLASGFVLIPAFDLPGTIAAAGCVNLAIAAVVGRLSRSVATPLPAVADSRARYGSVPLLLVAVSFLTGASSFIYEVGWIRMLSLALGSATHSFELMLCAFIVGLALGGFWIRKRIDTAANPGVLLGYVQIAMGVAAIATIPLYNASFDLTAWVVNNVPRTENGYLVFNLVRYGIASVIMFPAAFCAGMTLPLATRLLHSNEGHGERAIGVIYSANTIGAISGLGFAVYIGFPVFGLEYLVASGALLDVSLGIVLLAVFAGRARLRLGVAVLMASAAGTALAAMTFNPQKLVAGGFRTGKAQVQGKVLEIAHGRTATISVEQSGRVLSIRTNGKSDASAVLEEGHVAYQMDEVTMTLAAAFPMMLHEAPQQVANIGFGSGITSATILADPRVQRLDSVEIEPKVVELARRFGRLNEAAYADRRSTIHIDDAKSFFAANGRRYDVIVSEPSNPWVSGVSGLFSVEFYRHVARYLNPEGLFVQWMQMYETHPERVASVMKALDQSFEDYLVVALNYGDLLLIAKPKGQVVLPPDAFARLPDAVRATLHRLEVRNQADVALRVIGNKRFWRPWIETRSAPANSDFAPYLDTHADYDRFVGKGWGDVATLVHSAPFPMAELLAGRQPFPAGVTPTATRQFGDDSPALMARIATEALTGAPSLRADAVAKRGLQIVEDCRHPPNGDKPYALAGLAIKVLPYLPRADALAVVAAAEPLPCFQDLHPQQAFWPVLLRHVAAGDAIGFGAAAERLLDDGQGATPVRAQYLVGMGLLGRLNAGDTAAAQAIWAKHQPRLGAQPLNLSLEILQAHAAAGK